MASTTKVTNGDLAKAAAARYAAIKAEKKDFVDPFTLGEAFPVQITAEEVGENKFNGAPQVKISLSIVGSKGKLEKATTEFVTLPVVPDSMDPEQVNEFMTKTGDRFAKFLTALMPDTFKVFSSINKDDPKGWVFLDLDNQPMSKKVYEQRKLERDTAVIEFAYGLVSGEASLVGLQANLTKVKNPHGKTPYLNWSAL